MPAKAAAATQRGSPGTLQELLLVVVLPFAYGASTRIPFVFAGVHVLRALRGGLPLVSAALGAYQVSRILGNCGVMLLGPRRALVTGAACGLAGYISLAALAAAPAAAAGEAPASAVAWFVGALAVVGLSEQITALQHVCRARYERAPDAAAAVRARLLLLYACNVAGTAVGFLASGVAYSRGGLVAAARVGAAFEAMLLSGSLLLFVLEKLQPAAAAQVATVSPPPPAAVTAATAAGAASSTPFEAAAAVAVTQVEPPPPQQQEWADTTIERVPMMMMPLMHGGGGGGGGARTSSNAANLFARVQVGFEAVAAQAEASGGGGAADAGTGAQLARLWTLPAPRLQPVSEAGHEDAQPAAAAGEDADGARQTAPAAACARDEPSWISYVIALTFCLQALLTGAVLSLAPIVLTQALRLDVLYVGLAFGAGEAVGTAALLSVCCTPRGRARLQRALPSPLGLLAVLAALGAAALLLAAVRARAAALLLLVAMMALNDVGTSMCGECLGNTVPARHYLRLNALANVLRRAGNTLTCTLSPLMYRAAAPALPFALFGAVTLAWAAALAALFAHRAQELGGGGGEGADGASTASAAAPPQCSAWSVAGRASRMAPSSVLAQLRLFQVTSFVSQERAFLSRLEGLVGAGGGRSGGGGVGVDAVAEEAATPPHVGDAGGLRQRRIG